MALSIYLSIDRSIYLSTLLCIYLSRQVVPSASWWVPAALPIASIESSFASDDALTFEISIQSAQGKFCARHPRLSLDLPPPSYEYPFAVPDNTTVVLGIHSTAAHTNTRTAGGTLSESGHVCTLIQPHTYMYWRYILHLPDKVVLHILSMSSIQHPASSIASIYLVHASRPILIAPYIFGWTQGHQASHSSPVGCPRIPS